MTFYQELQLNQAGSKQLIKQAEGRKEKGYHILVYGCKILLTLIFCVAFVTGFSILFGSDNSIVGVVVLLSVMAFRFADLGIHAPHALSSLMMIWGLMTFGPRLANAGNLLTELLVNSVCIFVLMLLGCHNVVMFNQSTLLLGYLLLYGYDVSGRSYLLRIGAMAVGGLMTGIVFYRNHRNCTYKRNLRHIFRGISSEFFPLKMADLCDTWGFINYFSLWSSETSARDVGCHCGHVCTCAISERHEKEDTGENSGKYFRRRYIPPVIYDTAGMDV